MIRPSYSPEPQAYWDNIDGVYRPFPPGDGEVACPRCAEDRCEHDSYKCAECGGPDCTLCKSTGVIAEYNHPSWCEYCGLASRCRNCDPIMPWEQ